MDTTVFDRFCRGDREAFGEIYNQLKTPVYTICCRILGSREAAEDVTHDVFVKLWRSPPQEPVKNPRAWVFQVAHNLAIDALRRQAHTAPAREPPPSPGLEWVDARLDLERALAALSPAEREVLALRLSGSLSFREVADILGSSLPAVYRSYQRALKRLGREMNGGSV